MTPTIQNLLDACGLGFQHLVTTLVIELLNASEEGEAHGEPEGRAGKSGAAERALEAARALRGYPDEPRAPMPLGTIASFVQALGSSEEPRYAAAILQVWRRPWNPRAIEETIFNIQALRKEGK